MSVVSNHFIFCQFFVEWPFLNNICTIAYNIISRYTNITRGGCVVKTVVATHLQILFTGSGARRMPM